MHSSNPHREHLEIGNIADRMSKAASRRRKGISLLEEQHAHCGQINGSSETCAGWSQLETDLQLIRRNNKSSNTNTDTIGAHNNQPTVIAVLPLFVAQKSICPGQNKRAFTAIKAKWSCHGELLAFCVCVFFCHLAENWHVGHLQLRKKISSSSCRN